MTAPDSAAARRAEVERWLTKAPKSVLVELMMGGFLFWDSDLQRIKNAIWRHDSAARRVRIKEMEAAERAAAAADNYGEARRIRQKIDAIYRTESDAFDRLVMNLEPKRRRRAKRLDTEEAS